jgi:hypothetical protein
VHINANLHRGKGNKTFFSLKIYTIRIILE